ncbi:MAG TPA: glycosyltransferase, partial [Amaricoccus sp.]|nr:glycosyltransferase [Amaricoccus sp.]
MRIVILGLSLSSSWGNGHATTYRALVEALHARGHEVAFLERDVPWYAENRDLDRSPHCDLHFYQTLDDLAALRPTITAADAVVLGSYVPEGVRVAEHLLAVAEGPVAFYDIDTPVTLAKLEAGDHEYLTRALIPCFDLY